MTVPLGQTATFSVTATGTEPIRYQWSKGGVPITGATQSSYTTPEVILSDSGSRFSVVVSNSAGSVTSAAATLTVGPRSPKDGDLRFQLVASQYAGPPAGNGLVTDVSPGYGWLYQNQSGTPIQIGYECISIDVTGNCLFSYAVNPLPANVTDLNSGFMAGWVQNIDADIASMNPANAVLNSLNLQPGYDCYGMSWFYTSTSTGLQYSKQTIALNALQDFAGQQGLQGRVITALSYDQSGNVVAISYGWSGDTTTAYESQVTTATFSDIAEKAKALGAEGYIITALGGGNDDTAGNPIHGLLLVGTRVQGDSLPRPIDVLDQNHTSSTIGYARQVGQVWSPSTGTIIIVEK